MDSDEPQQPAVGEPAGQQLKRARESHGLSQKDIADAQHLRLFIIQAIEDGNYQQIDSELFLKGYVRAYAKQVGADADDLIRTLDLELEPLRREKDKEEQENPLVDIERRRRKKRRVAKTLGVMIVLAGIAFAGWKLVLEPRMVGEDTGEDAVGDQQASDQAGALPEADPSAGSDDLGPDDVASSVASPGTETAESSDLESEVDLIDQPVGGQDTSVNAGPEPVQESERVDDPSELPEMRDDSALSDGQPLENPGSDGQIPESASDQRAGGAGGNGAVGNEVAAVETIVQPDPVFEESAQPQALTAQTRLEMTFVSDCWVQVTDSSGARLVASLQREGDQVSVSGRAPMNVVIGAVDAVSEVSFAGEEVDLSSFRVVNNRTEFTLTL